MPKREDREYRTMPLMAIHRDAEGVEEPKMFAEGYATTFDDPYLLYETPDGPEYEMVSRHALDNADLSDVIMLYDHEGRVFARTKNNSLELIIDDIGLLTKADLGRTSNARNMLEDIEAGMITQMSWCFVIKKEHWEPETRCWVIDEVGKVYDVSAVSIPADPSTSISAARKRNRDGVISGERAERLAADKRRKLQMVRLKAKLAAQKG